MYLIMADSNPMSNAEDVLQYIKDKLLPAPPPQETSDSINAEARSSEKSFFMI